MSELYRIGQEDGRLIYRGDKLFAMVFDSVDAATVVREWNASEGGATSAEPAESEPETFRDGYGDMWARRSGGLYVLLSVEDDMLRTLENIKATYGTWTENAR